MTLTVLTATLVVILSVVIARKYRERSWGKCTSKRSMSDKTVIITGANSGIGKATAEELAKRGAKVIMACRDVKKAQKAMYDIRRNTDNGILRIAQLDLASFASIEKFAEEIASSEQRLDVLINNAGVFHLPYMLTEDGYEMQFGVNHLGHFLLTKLLLEKLKQSAPSRVVNVTSSLYSKGPVNFEELNSEQQYDRRKAYSSSKLANILFTKELAKRLEGTGVHVYAVSPGMVWTNLGRHLKTGWLKMALFAPLALFFVRMPKQGCQTVVHCAICEDVDEESGLYYRNCVRAELKGVARDSDDAKALWEFSEKCVAADR